MTGHSNQDYTTLAAKCLFVLLSNTILNIQKLWYTLLKFKCSFWK